MIFLLMPNEEFWYKKNDISWEKWDILNKIWVAKHEMQKILAEKLPSSEIQKNISDFVSSFTLETIFLNDIYDPNRREEMRQTLKKLPELITTLDYKTTQRIFQLLERHFMKH